MINAKVAVLADAFGIQSAVIVSTFSCKLCAALCMIAIFAHSVGIVLFGIVGALSDYFAMFLENYTSLSDLAILRGLLFALRTLCFM